MNTLRLEKGRNRLVLDRNRDEGCLCLYLDGAGLTTFLSASELEVIGAWATKLSRELRREEAYREAQKIRKG